jgi:hypothetical protein
MSSPTPPSAPPSATPSEHHPEHHHRRPHRHHSDDNDPFLTLTADRPRSPPPAPAPEPKDSLAVRVRPPCRPSAPTRLTTKLQLLLAPLLALTFLLSLALTDRRARSARSTSTSPASTSLSWTVRARRWWRPATGAAAAAAAGGGAAASTTGGEAWVIHERHRATISIEMQDAWDRRAGVLAGLLLAAGAGGALVLVAFAWAWARWWG